MSYNRVTQTPCSNCCTPTEYTDETALWTVQSSASKIYNINALHGTVPNSTTTLTTTFTFGLPTDCEELPYTTCETSGFNAVFTMTDGGSGCRQVAPDHDWEGTCQSGSGLSIQCVDAQEYCFDCDSDLGGCDSCDFTSGSSSLVQGVISNETMTETDWHASGVYISGIVEDFVGYPTQYDDCHEFRKSLRKIEAKKTSGGELQIRWTMKKEWITGEENVRYTATMPVNQNELLGYKTSIDLNNDIGIHCSGGNTKVFQFIRLGNGVDWYDITGASEEFQYVKPNSARWVTTYNCVFGCIPDCSGTNCCEDCCDCANDNVDANSAWGQKLLSTDIEDNEENCIWEGNCGGTVFGGSWTCVNTSPCMPFSGSLSVS